MSSTVVRINPGAQTQHINNYQIPSPTLNVFGRVFHVVKNENDLGYTDWTSIGKIYFTPLSTSPPKINELNKDIILQYENQTAYPLIPYINYFPVIGEIVPFILFQNKYHYTYPVNIYNSQHHNSQVIDNINNDGTAILGSYISEKSISPLYAFEGDLIINGRWGQSIRFSSTLKYTEIDNTWSKFGNEGDPITKIVNGYNYTDDSGKPHIENINKDKSSIYLTSNQSIDLIPSRFISSNPITSPLIPSSYIDSQLILASDRITLNSKKDEIILCANTNIELAAKRNIHFDSDENILLNSPKIFLGVNDSITPTEPVLLGKQTFTLLSDLISALNQFSSDLKLYKTQGEGMVNPIINSSADILRGKLKGMRKRLVKIYSKTVFVAN